MRTMLGITVCLLAIALAGCGTASRTIQQKSQGEKTDVFVEVRGNEALSEGASVLIIKANIKTHAEGYYVLESKDSTHGKQSYPFVINIDGQAVLWKVEGVKDSNPKYDTDGKASLDPEAGEGIKYILEKKLRIAPGMHKVFFGLPEDSYFREVEISLKEGEASTLEFKPIYKTTASPIRKPCFLREINRYEAFLNGNEIL